MICHDIHSVIQYRTRSIELVTLPL
jgi:hypothetical protein